MKSAAKIWIILLLISGQGSFAQQGYFQHFHGMSDDLYGTLDRYGSRFHVSVQPWLEKEVKRRVDPDTLYLLRKKTGGYDNSLLLNHHFFRSENKTLRFRMDPLVETGFGAGTGGNGFSGGGAAGLALAADFGKKITVGGFGSFHQWSFPGYVERYVHATRVIPGGGYARKSAAGGYYFWDGEVYANYAFLKYFNLEAGMGRNFWGDGHRSMFLSDHAFSYPYIKLTTSVWNIKYVNLYTAFKDMRSTTSSRWNNMSTKYGNLHYLSWDISKRVNLGFFEAVIWQNKDTSMHRGFDVNYINPLIFIRPVEFSMGSPDNTLLGLSLKVKVAKKNVFYGQFLIDDIIWSHFTKGSLNRFRNLMNRGDSTQQYGYWTNKQAWQLGFRSYDIFRVPNLDVQLEYNAARPYTYSHRIIAENYGHYNQPLAHPMGANFSEVLGFLRYRSGRWFLEGQAVYISTGLDSAGTHFGQDIFKSTFDTYYPELDNIVVPQFYNSIAQGIKTRILYAAVRAAWLINPANGLRVETGLAYRNEKSRISEQAGFIFTLGIRSGWRNRTVDY